MALKPEPTAPFHSVRHALRVLEASPPHQRRDRRRLARETGLPPAHLAQLLRMLRREGYVEQVADGAYVSGASLSLLGSSGARPPDRRRAPAPEVARPPCATRSARRSTSAATSTARSGSPSTPTAPPPPRSTSGSTSAPPRTPRAIGKCLLTQLDHNGRRDHLSRHKIARLTSRTITSDKLLLPSWRPAGHGPRARPPGVRGRHGLRRRSHHGRLLGGLPGALPPGRTRPPAPPGRRHPEPRRTGAAVAGASERRRGGGAGTWSGGALGRRGSIRRRQQAPLAQLVRAADS